MEDVKSFYRDIPFNYSKDVQFYINSIINSNQILEYSDLHNLLRKRSSFLLHSRIQTVIEFGCGTGWLTNSLGYYYNKLIKSIDFTKKAVYIASEVSKELKINADYIVKDIFEYQDKKTYDLVISLGVLHHTSNCYKAFKKISRFVKPGGYLYVGLYHLYGRRPMLELLQQYSHWHGQTSAFNLFKKMNGNTDNVVHSYSWFRDQVLHPHETQHTLSEVKQWLNEIGFELRSTSINNYNDINKYDSDRLDKLERDLENYSYKKNIEDLKFNPGYFTICAQKPKNS